MVHGSAPKAQTLRSAYITVSLLVCARPGFDCQQAKCCNVKRIPEGDDLSWVSGEYKVVTSKAHIALTKLTQSHYIFLTPESEHTLFKVFTVTNAYTPDLWNNQSNLKGKTMSAKHPLRFLDYGFNL